MSFLFTTAGASRGVTIGAIFWGRSPISHRQAGENILKVRAKSLLHSECSIDYGEMTEMQLINVRTIFNAGSNRRNIQYKDVNEVFKI